MELTFEKDAVETIARLAYERKTGARGLRSIMEDILMDTMYEIPSDESIEECIITEDTVKEGNAPLTIHKNERRIGLNKAI